MEIETKIITETILAPTIDTSIGEAYDSDPFPNLREHLNDGYSIRQLTISVFDLKIANDDGENTIFPQLNCVAILDRPIQG